MVDDHGKANGELKGLASQKGVTLPAELDAAHKATQAKLAKLSGAAFDRAYMQDMVKDHDKDVAAFSILIIVLIFMPSGLLGRADVEKV